MKMAEDKNVIVCFNNEETQNEWINLIESEIAKFSEKEDNLLHILKIIEKNYECSRGHKPRKQRVITRD